MNRKKTNKDLAVLVKRIIKHDFKFIRKIKSKLIYG